MMTKAIKMTTTMKMRRKRELEGEEEKGREEEGRDLHDKVVKN